MPAPELTSRKQTAVLWPFVGYDQYGQPTVGPPVEIKVRWNTTRTEGLNPTGNSISLDGSVVVAQDVKEGSRMWLGSLNQWYGATGSGSGSGRADNGLMEVKTITITPDLKNRFTMRSLGLVRYRSS